MECRPCQEHEIDRQNLMSPSCDANSDAKPLFSLASGRYYTWCQTSLACGCTVCMALQEADAHTRTIIRHMPPCNT